MADVLRYAIRKGRTERTFGCAAKSAAVIQISKSEENAIEYRPLNVLNMGYILVAVVTRMGQVPSAVVSVLIADYFKFIELRGTVIAELSMDAFRAQFATAQLLRGLGVETRQ